MKKMNRFGTSARTSIGDLAVVGYELPPEQLGLVFGGWYGGGGGGAGGGGGVSETGTATKTSPGSYTNPGESDNAVDWNLD